MSSIVTQGQSRKQTDLIAFLCPRQELNLRPAGLQPEALPTELQGRGTCAPTRIRAGGRRAHSSGGGTRTRDPGLMKPMLCHLSYTRIRAANSALTLHDAASIHFCPGGRTRTYNIHCIRVALSPVELRRKRRKQNCGRSAPRRASTTCRFDAGGKRTSREIERKKQNPRRSSAERFLFSPAALPRLELGQPK